MIAKFVQTSKMRSFELQEKNSARQEMNSERIVTKMSGPGGKNSAQKIPKPVPMHKSQCFASRWKSKLVTMML